MVFRVDDITVPIRKQVQCPFISPDKTPSHCAFAFGAGPRICKGKQLGLNVIVSFIQYYYEQNNFLPDFKIRAGRFVSPAGLEPEGRSKEILFFSGLCNDLLVRDRKNGDMVKRGDRFLVHDSCFL